HFYSKSSLESQLGHNLGCSSVIKPITQRPSPSTNRRALVRHKVHFEPLFVGVGHLANLVAPGTASELDLGDFVVRCRMNGDQLSAQSPPSGTYRSPSSGRHHWTGQWQPAGQRQ